MIIETRSYPRAGLIGNPSDGYYGKTISFTFSNFSADVVLYETPELEILPNRRDHSRFNSIDDLAADVKLFGYYGGIRLLKATVKRFHDYCQNNGITIHSRNFTIRYSSNIPHLVGLAGSSAIITACMRALMAFYGVTIPKTQLANLILSVETEELQISAGLQDRVAQTYQGLVYMDFDESLMRKQGYGCYEELDVSLISNIYIAYRTNLAQISGVFHSDMRHRFRKRDRDVLDAIEAWKELTTTARNMITNGEAEKLAPLLDANFDHRAALGGVSDGNMELVRLARSAGVSAKLTGSGGAIVGTYENEQMFQKLKETMTTNEIEVLKPNIASALKES